MSTVLEKTIEIIFQGDDRSGGAISSVIGNLGNLEVVVRGVTAPLADIADGVLKTNVALNSLAGAGLAYAYAKAVEFEGAMLELAKVIGADQVEALDRAKQAAIELSNAYGVSAKEIIASMANFSQAGFTVEEAMQLTANALDLVIAGNVEAAQASELLVAALKGFGAPAADAGRLIDVLNEISNNYATNVEQLAIGMAGISPIAKTMGLSFEETAGILTPVIETFRSGSEAADALKTGLLKLVDDAKPVRDALASIGVSQTDANGALRSGKDILYDVMEAFTGLSQEQKLFVTQQLVGIDQAARMVTVFDNLEYVLRVTETAMGAAGSAAAEVAIRLASAEVEIARFKVSVENLAVAIGDKLMVATTGAVSGITAMMNAIRTSVDDGAFDPLFDMINEFAERFGQTLQDIAKALPDALGQVDFTGLVDSFQNLAAAAEGLFRAIFPEDLSSADGLADAIQKIVNAWTNLNNITAGIVQAWQPLFNALGQLIAQLGDSESALSQWAIELGNLLGGAQVVDALIEKFGLLGSTVAMIAIDGLNPATEAGGRFANTMLDGVEAVDAMEGSLGNQLINSLRTYSTQAGEASSETDLLAAALERVPEDKVINVSAEHIDFVQQAIERLGIDIESLPEEKLIALYLAQNVGEWNAVINSLNEIPEEKRIDIATDLDTESIEYIDSWLLKDREMAIGANTDGVDQAEEYIDSWLLKDREMAISANVDDVADTDEYIDSWLLKNREIAVRAEADQPSFDTVGGQLDTLAEDKKVQVEVDSDPVAIQKIKSQFETIQAAIEWKAKLDIAEVEANAQIVEAIANTLGEAFRSSGEIISSAFGAIGSAWGDMSWSDQAWIQDVVQSELALREKSLKATESLVNTQVAYMEAKIAAMQAGQALIQIDGAGLQPHLEAFMWEVLAAIQVRVNEEGHAMLFGL